MVNLGEEESKVKYAVGLIVGAIIGGAIGYLGKCAGSN
jgi:hypothetical protein